MNNLQKTGGIAALFEAAIYISAFVFLEHFGITLAAPMTHKSLFS
ncbi:hypothetical protein [Shewanella woodyi]